MRDSYFMVSQMTELFFYSKPTPTLSPKSVSDRLNKIKVWFAVNILKTGRKRELFLLTPYYTIKIKQFSFIIY